jgi:hypothetical protein
MITTLAAGPAGGASGHCSQVEPFYPIVGPLMG